MVLSFLYLGLSCTGCSGSNDAALSVPRDQFLQRFAEELCSHVAPCCQAAGIPYGATACQQAATQEIAAWVAEYSTLPYDARAAGECLTQHEAALDQCFAFDDELDDGPCGRIFDQNSPVGDDCKTNTDCASGICQLDSSKLADVCVAARPEHVHGKAGAACAGQCYSFDGSGGCSSGSVVAGSTLCYESDGLFCDSDSGECAARAALGTACPTVPCVAGAYCNFDSGVCEAIHESGVCFFDSFDTDPGCSDTSYCTADTVSGARGECLPKKPDGAPCQLYTECISSQCDTSGTCGAGPAASVASCQGDLF
jgi:hypothetical protein